MRVLILFFLVELKIYDCSQSPLYKEEFEIIAFFAQRIFFHWDNDRVQWICFFLLHFPYTCIRVMRHKLFVLKFNRDLILCESVSFTILKWAIERQKKRRIEVCVVCKMRLKRFLAHNLTDVFAMCILSFNVKIVLATAQKKHERKRKAEQ